MIVNGLFHVENHLPVHLLLRVARNAHADALHQALGQRPFIVHIDQLVFQGGRTGVHDQDFHKNRLLYHF